MGGGTPARWRPGLRITGLSPRGRGNRPVSGVIVTDGGSIPAWAGEPKCAMSRSENSRVYPRVGGGTTPAGTTVNYYSGLSPRGRGNRMARRGS